MASSKIKVDDKVVHKLLMVNPDLRRGRTTQQVKRAFENGESIGKAGTPVPTHPPAQPHLMMTSTTMDQARAQSLNFFIAAKSAEFQQRENELAARKLALIQEEQALRLQTREQLVAFLQLVHAGPANSLAQNLGGHASFLEKLQTTGDQLAAQVEAAVRR